MIINNKKIINLPVFTEAGQEIGRLADFEIDIDSQSIINYYIIPHHAITSLFKNRLIINRGQIIDISEDKIIVSDNFVKSKEKKFSTERKKQPVTSPTLE